MQIPESNTANILEKDKLSSSGGIAVIIPAAAFGARMGYQIAKQFIQVDGKKIPTHTVEKIQTWENTYSHEIVIITLP